jgi:hypothetical protein
MGSSDKAVIKLGAIAKGERITIMAQAACGSTGTITLLDDSKTYATLKKDDVGINTRFLGYGSGIYDGAPNLRVELNISHVNYAIKLKPLVNHWTISDCNGAIKGGVYNIAVDDWTDDDYNDYVITVVSTKKAN